MLMLGHNSVLAKRLLVLVVLITSLLMCSSASIFLYRNFQTTISDTQSRVESIRLSSLPALRQSVWDYNFIQIEEIISGLADSKDIVYAEVEMGEGYKFTAGEAISDLDDSKYEKQKFDLRYVMDEDDRVVGAFTLIISYKHAYEQLYSTSRLAIIYILITLLVITFVITAAVNRSLTRHVIHIAEFTSQLSIEDLSAKLQLARNKNLGDELDILVTSINSMREKMRIDIEMREKAEEAVSALNRDLENKVNERTRALQDSMEKLEVTLDDLKATQGQLVEHEKMASLGSLVAGVAHEINTPIGVAYTASSHLEETVKSLNKSFLSGQLTKDEFSMAIESISECEQIICTNIQRAAELVRSFKMVAVDQSNEEARLFNLNDYFSSTITSLKPKIKKTHHSIELDVPENIHLHSFPGAYSQILTNLIINSVTHGFGELEEGRITIQAEVEDNELIIDFKDNGSGIDESIRDKLFEPFVTTNRVGGGSGLGTHIVYNLVTQVLEGSIALIDSEKGAHFQLRLPYTDPAIQTKPLKAS